MSGRSRPSSARPSVPRRTTVDRAKKHEELLYECKAAYLVVLDDTDDEITTQDQLCEVLQLTGRNLPRKVLRKYWTKSTYSLTFEDFTDICRKEAVTTEDDLMKAFRKIDINGDGYISNSELKRVLTSKGERMSTEEVQDIIDEVDENRDGRLDYKEFCTMLVTTQDECKKLAIDRMENRNKKRHKKSPRISEPDDGPVEAEVEDELRSEEDSDDDLIVIGSVKPKSSSRLQDAPFRPTPKPRKTKPASVQDTEETPKASPRIKERTKSPIATKDHRLPRPRKLKDWHMTHSKGCFFIGDEENIISHQYGLELSQDSSVWITVEPFSLRPGGSLNSSREVNTGPVDTMLFILRSDNSLVTFTEQRDTKGKYGVRCDLERGVYKLIPFTTGCRFKPRRFDPDDEVKLLKKKEDKFVLTKSFRDALTDVFEMCDLDGNGLISKSEFTWYNLRTSGEELGESEWQVVEENVDLKNGELTKKGFQTLIEMEAEDNDGDAEELWVTLTSMGFNRSLVMDEACLFFMEIYSEESEVSLMVSGLESAGNKLDRAVIDATIGKGEATKVKHMRDLYLHTYMTDFRACMVVENKSHSSVNLELDCSRSKNCSSHRNSLEYTVEVPPRSSKIGHHLMPTRETQEWCVKCLESVVK